MPTAPINDHEMYYEVLGAGDPVLCMAAGARSATRTTATSRATSPNGSRWCCSTIAASAIRACVGFDSRAPLPAIRCPSLISHAGKDVVTAPRTTLPIEAGIPGAQGLHWDDVAHVVAGREQKVRFARTLFDWLAAH